MPAMPHSLIRILVLLACFGAAQASAAPYVCMDTNVGEFCMELFPEAAPNTVANFLHYVDDGDYSDSMIHRSVPGFVIQGGGFRLSGNAVSQVPLDPPVVNEYNQSNLRGTVAMARVGGSVNSATSQWFVNLANNIGLDTVDGGFTVFGRVITGMDVVDDIAALRRVDLRSSLSSAFGEVPTTAPDGATQVTAAQLVRVIRAYRTERHPGLLPYQCSLASPGDTLTEFCGSTVSFPVEVDGVLYEGTLQYLPGRANLEFAVDMAALRQISDTGQARARFVAGTLTIPSVRYGALALDDVKLALISQNPLEFRVTGYTAR